MRALQNSCARRSASGFWSSLDAAYLECGAANGAAAVLLRGLTHDVQAYAEVAPRLASVGLRAITRWLRDVGPTRFAEGATPRSRTSWT